MHDYIRWANPDALTLLWLIPLVALLYVHSLRARARALAKLVSPEAARRLLPVRIRRREVTRATLMTVALALLVVAVARPQVGAQMTKVKRQGVDVVVAIDTSASMLARDAKPDRLDVARDAVRGLISRMRGDRIGIVTFAADAFVYCPLTIDYGAALMFLDALGPQVTGQAGTSLAGAIDESLGAFTGAEHGHQQIVLISDGEDHEGGAEQAAKRAADAGACVHVIGIGGDEGEPIPELNAQGQVSGHKRDRNGKIVLSHMNEEPLRKIAAATGGVYVRASETGVNIEPIYARIESAEARELGTYEFTEYQDRFQWPLLAAIILIAIHATLADTRGRDAKS